MDPLLNKKAGSLFDNSPAQETVYDNPEDLISEEMALRAMTRGFNRVNLKNKWRVDWGGFLTKDDLVAEARAQMDEEEVVEVSYPRLRKIRTIHHQVAIMLSGGTKPVDVARTLGMTPSRIYMLQKDPAFSELLQTYKSSSVKETLDAQMRALGLGTLAMEQLMDQMLDEGAEEMSPGMLLKISTEMLDRAGYSPQAQKATGNTMPAPSEEQIQALKRVERSKQEGTVITRKGGEGNGSSEKD